MKEVNIRKLNSEELSDWFREAGEPSFRGKQVYEWLWQKRVRDFSEMTNLPKALRSRMAEHFSLPAVQVETLLKSNDGTIKFGFRLHDGHTVEGVLIPSGERMTACISSQAGCSLSCSFCATGTLALKRNVNFDEIYDQVAIIEETARTEYGHDLSNIVYMGMGEPLLNFQNVVNSIKKLKDPEARGMSPRRITVSTVGIAKMIRRLADEQTGVNLALSLHAASDEKRSSMMEINDTNPLNMLKDALLYYSETTNTMIFLEYLMLSGFNDQKEDIQYLRDFCRGLHCKINLIEYNPVSNADFKRASASQAEWFRQSLEDNGLRASIRRSRGMDIDAACGQLANKSEVKL